MLVGLACSFDAGTRPGPWTGDTEAFASSSSGDGDAEASGDEECTEPCDVAPSDCFEDAGACEKGRCVYAPRPASSECVDDCPSVGVCGETGTCMCPQNDCAATCVAGPNATATCSATGECTIACVEPWADCDQDPANGCEIPVGVPHQCSLGGIDPVNGCWAAYCGPAVHDRAIDFGTFHCVDCQTCREPASGECQWCNHDDGTFYPVDRCECDGQSLDLACAT